MLLACLLLLLLLLLLPTAAAVRARAQTVIVDGQGDDILKSQLPNDPQSTMAR